MSKPIDSLDPQQKIKIQAFGVASNDDDTKFRDRLRKSIVVEAVMPENYGLSIGNEITETFGYLKTVGRLGKLVGVGTGLSFDRGIAERQYWEGVQNQEMSLELRFVAYESGAKDVLDPITNLMALSMPSEGNVLGGTAGTNAATALLDYWVAPPTVSIEFGSVFRLTDVWIRSVEAQFSNKLDDNFDPLEGTVSISFILKNPMGVARLFGGDLSDAGRNQGVFFDSVLTKDGNGITNVNS